MGRHRSGTVTAAAAAAAATVLLAGCAGSTPEAPAPSPATEATVAAPTSTAPSALAVEPTGPPTSAAPAPEPTTTARAAASGTPDVDSASDLVTGLQVPWDLAFLPDGSALVTLRDEARVLRVTADGATNEVTADGDDGRVTGVAPGGEGGLLGVTTDATAQHVFVYLTGADDNRVVRYAWDERADALTDPVPVVTGIPRSEVHNGGRIDLGPDGMLYVATGDARDTAAAPDPDSLAGKVLRVTVDGDPAPDNPDPASPVFSSGHRNVQGIGWSTDGTMWASEFGQSTTDELNVVRAGADHGWPEVEGVGGVDGLTDPVVTWGTDEASPSGIAVTDDAVYLAALRGQRLWRVPIADGAVTGEPEPLLDGLGRLRHVEVAPDGSLWVLTSNTFRGEPRDGDDRLVRVPLTRP
ncbi:PQQ-dependent sugar dehydrogenase [Aquipuribacter sp. MA13-6]|uniref:PQQ-dependent sugar dehydrogenase n=1 Tax=unclassified Aquipuribacter TaxID=2635084 RepID=UPI003EE84644